MSAAPLVVLTQDQVADLIRKTWAEARREAALQEVFDSEEAAKFLRMSKDALVKKAKSGAIPGTKLGSDWRFLRDELLAHLREKREAQ